MASNIRAKSSSFGKKVVVSLFMVTTFVCIPIYISLIEVRKSKDSFSSVTLIEHLKLAKGEKASEKFADYGYNLSAIRDGSANVPSLFLEELPRELTTMENASLKKDLFISALLPPILKVNEFILAERQKLEDIIAYIELNGKASTNDLLWLQRKMNRYRLEEFNIDELYRRMNIIPPSLALTQAAIETGWGTSRFAQQANALYGQWTWNDNEGMIPLGREEGKTHSIKRFKNLISAVEGYALNLNTHPAYSDFRIERSQFKNPKDIKVSDLLITLIFYSERGYEYIDSLSNIIRINGLGHFDHVTLEKPYYLDARLDQAP